MPHGEALLQVHEIIRGPSVQNWLNNWYNRGRMGHCTLKRKVRMSIADWKIF